MNQEVSTIGLVVSSNHRSRIFPYLGICWIRESRNRTVWVGTCEAIKVRRKCDSGDYGGVKVNVVPKWLRISQPTKGAGQAGITKKE